MILWLASSDHSRDSFVRWFVRRVLGMRPGSNPSPFLIVFIFVSLVSFGAASTNARARASRIDSIRIRIHLLHQVVRASPRNANLDSNKTALSQTALARIDACAACAV